MAQLTSLVGSIRRLPAALPHPPCGTHAAFSVRVKPGSWEAILWPELAFEVEGAVEDKCPLSLTPWGWGRSGRLKPREGQWESCLAQASLGARTVLEEAEGWWHKTGLSLGYRVASTELGHTQLLGLTATGWASCYTGAPVEVHAHGGGLCLPLLEASGLRRSGGSGLLRHAQETSISSHVQNPRRQQSH